MKSLRLGTAGMRGEIGTGLTPSLIQNFAAAFGTYIEGGTVIVGRDTRFSSLMVYHAAVSSLLSCGCRVIDAGLCPAPLLHFLVPHLDLDAGLLLGAGHHPAGWNAIVPLGADGAYLNAVRMQELLDVYHSRRFESRRWNSLGTEEEAAADVAVPYLDRLCSFVDRDAIRRARFKVVADFCNGSGSVLGRAFAERLGLDLIPINDLESGILPHDPEPRPRSSMQAQSIQKVTGAAVGFVFNSDMSRTAIVSCNGETLSEEYSFPLVADRYLERMPPPATVVTNWCTTRTLDEIVRQHGGVVCKSRIGQAPLVDRMLEADAEIAGDGSGSVVFRPLSLGFDGFLAMAMILESMAVNGCSSSDLVARLPRHHIVKRSIPCPSARAYAFLRNVKDSFPDAAVSEEDGIRFDWPDGWAHLRASATEPIVRMIVEWNTVEEAESRAISLRGMLERLVAS
jgi:phosphomannomutase